MRKRYKFFMTIIIILLASCALLGLLSVFNNKKPKEATPSVVINNIEEFGYNLEDRDTKYMQEIFRELQDILKNEEIDYQEYAQILTKLFITDFYTLNNKVNKYDIGGEEYILSSSKESFRLKAMDTIYKDIIDNTYKDRRQDLPEVSNVEIKNIEETTLKVDKEEINVYKVEVNIDYQEDLGYDNKGTIYLTKVDKKLEIVRFEPTIEEE